MAVVATEEGAVGCVTGWPSVAGHVRALVRAMSTDERELVTFRIVSAKVSETGNVSEEDILAHKKAIKALVIEEIAALRGDAEDDGSNAERLDSKTPVHVLARRDAFVHPRGRVGARARRTCPHFTKEPARTCPTSLYARVQTLTCVHTHPPQPLL